MSGRETFDVSPNERKILEARAARRTKLRHEYLKEIGNPYKMASGDGGTVFDSGLARFTAMRVKNNEYWRPTLKNAFYYFGGVVTPIVLITYLIVRHKDAREHLYRTGQVSYRDREFKFM